MTSRSRSVPLALDNHSTLATSGGGGVRAGSSAGGRSRAPASPSAAGGFTSSEFVEAVQWRGDNFIEVIAFGGMLRLSGDGELEIYLDEEFHAVPQDHWIVRWGDRSEWWVVARGPR